jgi:hypothetical protein
MSVTDRQLAEMRDRLERIREAVAVIVRELAAIMKLRNAMAVRHTLTEGRDDYPCCDKSEHQQE